jgi:hypothetical protein
VPDLPHCGDVIDPREPDPLHVPDDGDAHA